MYTFYICTYIYNLNYDLNTTTPRPPNEELYKKHISAFLAEILTRCI